MLTREEALLFKAVQEEQARQQALGNATTAGGLGGAAMGALAGRGGRGRLAGGLTGLILGGGLGAGASAMMQRESQAGKMLGKIQAQNGQLSAADEIALARLLGDIYQNPSQVM